MRTYLNFGVGEIAFDDVLLKKAKNQSKKVYVNIFNGKLVRRVSDNKDGSGNWQFLANDVNNTAVWLTSIRGDDEYLNNKQYTVFFDPSVEAV